VNTVLAVATILGGIAAIWYFWDKIVELLRGQRVSEMPTPASAPAPVPAPAPGLVEKWVDSNYPRDSGLQTTLEAAGYKIVWCLDTKLARRLDLEGWEVVVEPDAHGVVSKFRSKDRPANQTLIKKRVSR